LRDAQKSAKVAPVADEYARGFATIDDLERITTTTTSRSHLLVAALLLHIAFPVAALAPNVLDEIDAREMGSGLATAGATPSVNLTVKQTVEEGNTYCPSAAGLKGDGSIAFASFPSIDGQPWPWLENHAWSGETLNRRNPTVIKRGIISGFTWLYFDDARTARADSPLTETLSLRAAAWWATVPESAGKCLYLQQLSLRFPQQEIFIAKEFWDARDTNCWYAATRAHEGRHIHNHQDAFSRIQQRVADLLADHSVPAPGWPIYAASEVLREAIKAAVLKKLGGLIDEELMEMQRSDNALDAPDNYEHEQSLCPLPMQIMNRWVTDEPGTTAAGQ
jgi:hypothetical protein